MTKALLVKAPSSLDVDLLKYDEVRFKVEYNAGQQYTPANLIDSTDDLTATFVKSDNMTFRNVGSKAVSLLQIDSTKPSSCIVSVRPFNTENITGICNGYYTQGKPKGIYTFYGSNLDVVKYLKNLIGLQLGDTSVGGDISALSGLTNLTVISLSDTSVGGDISALSGLTNLTNLSMSNTSISGDISALSGLTNLLNLYIYGTHISGDISAFNNLTKLTSLEIGGTAITGDIKTLADKMANKNIEHKLVVDVVYQGHIYTNTTYDGKACTQRKYTFHFKTDGTYTVE